MMTRLKQHSSPLNWQGLTALSFSNRDSKLIKYAVMINVDGDLMYVSGNNPFMISDEPLCFDTVEKAQEEADKWNTAMIVEMTFDKEKMN